MSVYSISNSSFLANVMTAAAGGIQFRTVCVFNRFRHIEIDRNDENQICKYKWMILKKNWMVASIGMNRYYTQHCAHEKYAFSCGRLTDVSNSVPRYHYSVYCARRTDRRTRMWWCVRCRRSHVRFSLHCALRLAQRFNRARFSWLPVLLTAFA